MCFLIVYTALPVRVVDLSNNCQKDKRAQSA